MRIPSFRFGGSQPRVQFESAGTSTTLTDNVLSSSSLTYARYVSGEMSVPVSNAGIQVSPNPAMGSLVVRGVPAGALVTPTDLLGRSISGPVRLGPNGGIDTSEWPRGWTLLRIETEVGVHVQRVLLR